MRCVADWPPPAAPSRGRVGRPKRSPWPRPTAISQTLPGRCSTSPTGVPSTPSWGASGRLDVLVNLAGTGRGAGEYEEDGFIHTVDVNLFGTMRVCYAARPLLAERGGAIVNTASMMSFFGSGSAPAYAASKGAVAQFTKSLAIAWAGDGIRVNAVAPGWIDTPMTTGISADRRRSEEILSRTPLGRWGRPEDVAEGIVFLASPRSTFVTGVILPVDGGYLIDGSPRPTPSAGGTVRHGRAADEDGRRWPSCWPSRRARKS